MEAISHKSNLRETFQEVRQLSYQEKTDEFMDEKRVNAFLDAILTFKERLNNHTKQINSINSRIESVTWFTDLDEDSLMTLNDLIAVSKDLRSSLIRQYVNMSELRRRGIAKTEIKAFKMAIDDLREAFEDIESVFFFLPEMPEFKEVTKKLSLI